MRRADLIPTPGLPDDARKKWLRSVALIGAATTVLALFTVYELVAHSSVYGKFSWESILTLGGRDHPGRRFRGQGHRPGAGRGRLAAGPGRRRGRDRAGLVDGGTLAIVVGRRGGPDAFFRGTAVGTGALLAVLCGLRAGALLGCFPGCPAGPVILPAPEHHDGGRASGREHGRSGHHL